MTASLTVNPPPSNSSCPPGHKLELASVSYSNVTLTDTTNGVSIAVGDISSRPGAFFRTFAGLLGRAITHATAGHAGIRKERRGTPRARGGSGDASEGAP